MKGIERFLDRLDTTGDCWLWTGPVDPVSGYARISLKGETAYIHQLMYILFKGPIPAGHQIDHLCHDPDVCLQTGPRCLHRRCGRPEHLVAATARENVLRGGGVSGRASRRDCCAHGHLYDEANTFFRKDRPGERGCRRCRADAEARRRRR